ncbi:VOC family protein [Bacillus spongiae]|uniref:VOC family protein n=1 Tax=Bacillus spongiae TaxID=2683610 RepID=A0ABU8HHW4_9BACI
MVSWEKFDEGIEWYTTHFGWECLDQVQTPVGKKAFLKMPKEGVITLKALDSDCEHLQNDEEAEEGNFKLCFEVGDLKRTVDYFNRHNIEYTEVVPLINGMKSLDVFGFENARLTLYENIKEKDSFPDARVLGFGEVHSSIGVTDIGRSVDWYTTHLGFLEVSVGQEHAHLQTEDAYEKHVLHNSFMNNIFLEKIDRQVKGNPSVRTYFDIRPEDFDETYQRLLDKKIVPSKIAGNPKEGWGGFHFFDPDGNRINVWSYPIL